MSAIEKTNSVLTQIKNLLAQKLKQPEKTETQAEKGDRFTRSQQSAKVTYDLEDIVASDAIKRPIKINDLSLIHI